MCIYFDTSAQQMPPIPLDAYQVCAVAASESAPMLMAVGFASLSLAYGKKPFLPFVWQTPTPIIPDVLIFSTIVYTAWRSNLCQFRIPTLLRTIVRDATHYFLVIFTSQLLLVFITILGRVRILSCLSVLSFSLAEALIAFNPIRPRPVSNARIHHLHLFTTSFSMEQWKLCVRPNASLHLKPSGLNWVSGTFR